MRTIYIILLFVGQCCAVTTIDLDCKLNYLICTDSLQLNNTLERCTCLEGLGTCIGKFEPEDGNIALITRECARLSCTYPCEYENSVAKTNVAIGIGIGVAFGFLLLIVCMVGGGRWRYNQSEKREQEIGE